MAFRQVKIDNGEAQLLSDEELKAILLKHLQHSSVRIYWRGSSECAKMLKNGKVQGTGRLGGREMAEKETYENFEAWYKESVLLSSEKYVIRIGLE